MKARIYQMIVELDTDNLMFRDFETVYKASGGKIPEELYECVYEGEFDAPCLEKLFYILNNQIPSDYHARSLSVSDVIEVVHSPEKSSFYYVDHIGYHLYPFNANGAMQRIANHDFNCVNEIRQRVRAYFVDDSGLQDIYCDRFVLKRCRYSESQLGYEITYWTDIEKSKPKSVRFFEKPSVYLSNCIGAFPRSLLKKKLESGNTRDIYGVHDSKILEVVEEWLHRNHWLVEKL